MWRRFLSRRLSLFSLQSSSSLTTITCPYFVRSSHFSSSNTSSSNAFSVWIGEIKIRVWWDFENCYLPTGVKLEDVLPRITSAFEAYGISGSKTFKAIGNVRELRFNPESSYFWSHMELSHIKIGEIPTYRVITDDIMYWVSRNPPPAYLFLISGDEAFAPVLNHLRMKNYNILIANNNTAPDHLCAAATVMWHWNSLVTGENLIANHFNNSLHCHLKASIEHALSTSKYLTSLNTEEVSESAPDSKFRPASEPVSESHSARVRVWWDLDNCELPTGINAVQVGPALTAALKANGINGPIEIIAFGDDRHLASANERANFWTAIDFNFIPNGGKTDVFNAITIDLLSWVSKNPPPVHLFLISGDGDFGCVLNRLRLKNYNILIACIERAPDALCSAATIMWHWNSLVRGEELIGKHLNYPPDDSWYCHFKAPIEDALLASEESTV